MKPTKTERQLLALQRAARKQTDPVKRAKILAKIRDIQLRRERVKWLAQ